MPLHLPFRLALLALLLAVSSPARAQWSRVADVPATEVGAVLVHDGTVYAGALDAVYTSRDGGTTWTRSAPLPAGYDGVWALAVHNGRLFAGSYGGVLESTDGGATWTRRDAGLDHFSHDVVAFDVHEGTLYAATVGGGVRRLDLAAANPVWQPYSDGLPGNVYSLFRSGDRLLAGASANGTVFVRDGGASSWSERRFIPFDSSGPRMDRFAEVAGVIVGGGSPGLFRSADHGDTWTRFSPGVGDFSEVSFVVVGTRVYAAATRLGRGTYVYASDDAGLTWTLVELVQGAITFDAAEVGGRLFTARFDGLWVRDLAPTAGEGGASASGVTLHAPRPNPAADATSLAFSLGVAGPARLVVFDALGREALVAFDGTAPSGETDVRLDLSRLPPGVYVARLVAGAQAASRRLVVAR